MDKQQPKQMETNFSFITTTLTVTTKNSLEITTFMKQSATTNVLLQQFLSFVAEASSPRLASFQGSATRGIRTPFTSTKDKFSTAPFNRNTVPVSQPQFQIHIQLIEQGLTSHQTHYRSYRGRVLWIKRPNQQCQSTEGREVLRTRLQSH